MINTLCIGSGGFRGISFLSALLYLEKQNNININKINTYSCVSVGCFIGILLIVGYKLNEIYEIIKETEKYKPEINFDLMFDNYGFDNGQKLMLYLKDTLLKKIDNPNISFLELYELTKKEIYIATTNFSQNKEEIFNHKDTPNVPVILAIRMSMSIPLIYTPILYENNYYVDGALTNSIYIPENCEPKNTLLIYLDKYKPSPITSIKDILFGSIFILSDQLIKKDINKYNCLKIQSDDIINMTSDMSNDIIETLILFGENAAKKYFKNTIKHQINELKEDINNKKIEIIKNTLNEMIDKIENELFIINR